MGKKKNNKGMFFMLLVFVIVNGVALYIISTFWDMNFTRLVVAFISIFILIEIYKIIKNTIIMRRVEEEERKLIEEARKKREETSRVKAERKQKAIALQQSRTRAMQKALKNRKKKKR